MLKWGQSASIVSIFICVFVQITVLSANSRLDQVDVADSFDFIPVTYREFYENVSYATDVQFDQKAMIDVYNLTRIIADFLIPKDAYPKGVIKINKGEVEVNDLRRNWKPIVKHYYIVTILILFVLIFGPLMPIVGFFFYCFRCCCGKCGARSQPFDKKYDACKKVFEAITLIGLVTLLLYGLVCAFICNVYLNDGFEQASDTVKDGLNDTQSYLSRTSREIDFLLVNNFDDLKWNLNELLDKCNDIISEKLSEYSNSASLTYLSQIVNNLPEVRNDLIRINQATNELRYNASKLSILLNYLKRESLDALKDCTQCSKLSDEINRLQITIDYDFQTDRYFPKLANVSVPLQNVVNILNESIIEEINKGHENFEQIKRTISTEIDDEKVAVQRAIDNAGQNMQLISNNITGYIHNLSKLIRYETNMPPRFSKDYFQYVNFYFYVGLVLSSMLLIITTFTIFGLICGVCGKRPDGYDDDCCNKGAGSRFLLLGVASQFLFSFFLSVAILFFLIWGLSSQRIICDPLRNPNSSLLISDLNQFVDYTLRKSNFKLDIKNVINNCHQNRSVFNVLNLQTVFNLNEIYNLTNKFEIEKRMSKLKEKIKFDDRITLITKNGKKKLLELANSELSDFPFHRIIDELSMNVTSIDLMAASKKLQSLKDNFPNDDYLDDKIYRFEQLSDHVGSIRLRCEELKNITMNVENGLKLNFTSLREAVLQLLYRIEESQQFLDKNGRDLIVKLATKFAEMFTSRIHKYYDRIVEKTQTSVGNCAQISHVYNSTLINFCDNILNPMNGLWMSLLFCLLLFVPTIYVSVKLSTLYQKTEPYSECLIQRDYLYDVYAEQDCNIPLTLVNLNGSGKKKHRRRKPQDSVPMSYVTSTDAIAADRPELRALCSQQPSKSSQKQWDDYSSAPPVYEQPEYERPPPYYYPGVGHTTTTTAK